MSVSLLLENLENENFSSSPYTLFIKTTLNEEEKKQGDSNNRHVEG